MSANLALQPLYPLSDLILSKLLQVIKNTRRREPNDYEKLFAGFLTGNFSVILANPYETTLIAAQRYKETAIRAFRRIYAENGLAGFYPGSIQMGLRNGTFVGGMFVSTPIFQKKIADWYPGNGKLHYAVTLFFGSTVPAIIFTTVAIPFDLMAIVKQSNPSQNISGYHSLKSAFQTFGTRVFTVGLACRLTATIIEMTGFNFFKEFYQSKLSN